jgi:hypothetical protein
LQQCPEWFAKSGEGCTIYFLVKNGFTYAAYMGVGGESWQDKIEKALTNKYGAPSDKSKTSWCKNRDVGAVTQQAAVRIWDRPGLRVVFNPLGVKCAGSEAGAGVGLIQVETATMRRNVAKHEVEREAAEPKM